MVSMRSLFAYFWRDPPRVIYFLVCCAVILVLSLFTTKNSLYAKLRNQIVLPSLLLIALFLNPVSTHFLLPLMLETRLMRFFWLLPISLLMGLTSVVIIQKLPQKLSYIFIGCGSAFLVYFCVIGQPFAPHHNFTVENWYKIPTAVIDLCDEIGRTSSEENRTALFPEPLNLWVRQYDASIRMPFAWNHVEDEMVGSHDMYTMLVLESDTPLDLSALGHQAESAGLRYIVLPSDARTYGTLNDNGYREIYRTTASADTTNDIYTKEYVLYCREETS